MSQAQPTKMELQLTEVLSNTEFESLIPLFFMSFENPLCKLLHLLFPVKDDTPEARQDAIDEAVIRLQRANASDRSCIWVKATEMNTGQLVGGACWYEHESDPFVTPSEHECTWFSPGLDRDVANSLMQQFVAPRSKYMRKPHMCKSRRGSCLVDKSKSSSVLRICFVHPGFRRKGVAKMLVDWGTKRADAENRATYLDATDLGLSVYRNSGFISDKVHEFSVDGFPPSDRLTELKSMLLPFQSWPMYRAVRAEDPERTGELPWKTAR